MPNPPWRPTPKSRRCYHRVISGIERGGTLRFLTLTASNQSPDTAQKSFKALYMRLKRRGLIKGYIKVPEIGKNGKQHLHVLFRGSYIEQAMISQWWQELHKAKIIDIRAVRRSTNPRKLASDMASYMSKPNSLRYSWNWAWVWRGFVKDWNNLKRLWHQLNHFHPTYTFQWLLNQWAICLKYNLRPSLEYLPPPP